MKKTPKEALEIFEFALRQPISIAAIEKEIKWLSKGMKAEDRELFRAKAREMVQSLIKTAFV